MAAAAPGVGQTLAHNRCFIGIMLCHLDFHADQRYRRGKAPIFCHSDVTVWYRSGGYFAAEGSIRPTIRCRSSTDPNSTTILPFRLPRLTDTRVS